MQMKTGLVLEGGAMRGLFTAGILDVFLEEEIAFDGMIGVSAGAAFGCNFKSKQIGRAVRYNMRFANDKRYCSLYSLLTTGDLYGVDFCYRQIPEQLDVFDWETFRKNPIEFYVVATDVMSGLPVYQKYSEEMTDFFKWLQASASMPLVSRVVSIDNRLLLDGGMSDSVPLRFFEQTGYQKNVVVLTQPITYQKEKNKFLPLMRLMLSKYPGLLRAMERRHEMYNETLEYIKKREQEGSIFVFRPKEKLPVNHIEHNSEKLAFTYAIGRDAAYERLNELKAFLKK